MLNYLDMFAGIGGFALGAEWAGIKFGHHCFSEIDKYSMQIYKRRFPCAIPLGDIRRIDYGVLSKWGGHGSQPADSLASPIAWRGKGGMPKTSAIFGLNVRGCSASYDRNMRFLKTFRVCLISMRDFSSTEYYRAFTKAGMMRNGALYQLEMRAPRICGSVSGSFAIRKWDRVGKRTLIAQDKSKAGPSSFQHRLSDILFYDLGLSGDMNPEFAESYMGYPVGWTDTGKDIDMQEPFDNEAGISYTVPKGSVAKRSNRIACLGNSIVPQIACYLWGLLKFN